MDHCTQIRSLIEMLSNSPLIDSIPDETSPEEILATLVTFYETKPEHRTVDQIFQNKVVPWVLNGCNQVDSDTGYLPSPLRKCENAW